MRTDNHGRRADDNGADVVLSPRGETPAHTLARGLGWFSIALGISELLLPRTLARVSGQRGREGLLRLYGVRDIATGLALLNSRPSSKWMWARVAGDAIDLATLVSRPSTVGGLASIGGFDRRTRSALGTVAAVAAIDVMCARSLACSEQVVKAAQAFDYSGRSGFSRPVESMRGAALGDFKMPDDMKTPVAMAPYPLTGDDGSSVSPEMSA